MALFLISALVLFPIVELIVAIKVGGAIGVLPLLALLIGMGLAGAAVLRWQGLNAARRTFEQLARHEAPVESMIDGIGLSLAGLLLLLPGLVSDVMALLLLVPPVRRRVIGSMLGLVSHQWSSRAGERPADVRPDRPPGWTGPSRPGPDRTRGDGVVIEGEFERVEERTIRPERRRGGEDDPPKDPPGSSPWRR